MGPGVGHRIGWIWGSAMAARRVVLVMIEPPAPFGDAAARWFYVLLRELVARGHRVTAFAACSRPREAETARDLFPGPDYDLRIYPIPRDGGGAAAKWRTLRRPYSYMFGDDFRRDLAAELARGFDVLHLEQLWSGWVGLGHARRAVVNVHYLARIDLAAPPEPGLGGRLRHRMMLGAERRLLGSYPRITTLSPRLTEAVAALAPRAEVSTVPLGIDATLYPFGADAPRPPTLGLIGSFNWQPSYAAAGRLFTRLWPEIRRQVPDARLLVVGRAARSALARFLDAPGLEIAEDVPDTIPYFRQIDALLYAPPRGSGMKVKVLEAFALGTPVVTNAEGIEGLPAVDGAHAGVAEDDAGLIARSVALLRDPASRQSRRLAARALLESHCGPGPTVDAVEAVHERIAAGGGRP